MKKFSPRILLRYHQTVSYLEGLSNLPIAGDYMAGRHDVGMYLKKMRYFLNLIGNPDQHMKFIHVAGTAGKGTVTNLLHEILLASGKNVGSFTSPAVTTTLEEIRVGKLFISPDEFSNIVDELKPWIDIAYQKGPYGRPSLYELLLAIALVYFRRQRCEWIVLEVGLGGRYDATNVIQKPVITMVTNIDYDHTELLGHTLQKIGFDKAGIIKRGSAFFTSERRPAIFKMFQRVCGRKRVSFTRIGRQKTYQEYNHALVTAIAKKLGINAASIRTGIRNARLPCRFERVQSTPTVILDGAHNRSKIKSTVENLRHLSFHALHLIIGMAQNKNHDAMLRQIIPHADRVSITRFQTRNRECAHPNELLIRAKKYLKKGSRIESSLDPESVLSRAIKRARKDDLILVTGSFFLAGELRKRWITEEHCLETRNSF
ncbi:MAG: Mur ligase family protein [Candidatus Uhrbacteria bacterium]|nr:Mur ligase family protein [Candidatus Uhrbacteria bacterium]